MSCHANVKEEKVAFGYYLVGNKTSPLVPCINNICMAPCLETTFHNAVSITLQTPCSERCNHYITLAATCKLVTELDGVMQSLLLLLESKPFCFQDLQHVHMCMDRDSVGYEGQHQMNR